MKSIHFPTATSPSPAKLPVYIGDFVQNAGAATCFLPTIEGTILTALCTLLGTTGRLFDGESGLGSLMAKTYAEISVSPSFMLTGSAVPFCMSTEPEGGHYFLHVPDGAGSSTPVLLLLHGYGGNLLYFPWAIWKEIPEAILIAPSWQINWSEGRFKDRKRYVEEALAHAGEKTGINLKAPWLVPLSQGGPTAFKLAASMPSRFSGLLGISTFADDLDELAKLEPDFPVRMLHGDHDLRVAFGDACDAVIAIQRSGGDVKITAIQGANHWLLLSDRKKMGDFLRGYI